MKGKIFFSYYSQLNVIPVKQYTERKEVVKK